MSASKANKQRQRAAEIRAELERLPNVQTPFIVARRRRLEQELRGLRFKDPTPRAAITQAPASGKAEVATVAEREGSRETDLLPPHDVAEG